MQYQWSPFRHRCTLEEEFCFKDSLKTAIFLTVLSCIHSANAWRAQTRGSCCDKTIRASICGCCVSLFSCGCGSNSGKRFEIQTNRAHISATLFDSVGQGCCGTIDRRVARILDIGCVFRCARATRGEYENATDTKPSSAIS